MYTLGFRFKPWTRRKRSPTAPSILDYVKEAAAEYGIDKHIRFGHKVIGADWSTPTIAGPCASSTTASRAQISCSFLFVCTGYYNYDEGYSPSSPAARISGGTIVHPQHWPEDLDYPGKKIVVIGSGATAVTLVPALVNSGPGT